MTRKQKKCVALQGQEKGVPSLFCSGPFTLVNEDNYRITRWKEPGALKHTWRRIICGPGTPTKDCYMNKKIDCLSLYALGGGLFVPVASLYSV